MNIMLYLNVVLSLAVTALPVSAALTVSVADQGGSPRVAVAGPTNTLFALERSENLVSWQRLVTNALSSASFAFTDVPITNASVRFYRAVHLAPLTPTSFGAVFDTNQQLVNLSWVLPEGAFETVIERRASSEANFTEWDSVGASTNHYQDDFLTAGVIYVYRVSACNDGGCSAPTAPISVAAPYLSTPAWQTAAYDGSHPANPLVNLCWTIPPGADSVLVERSTNGQVSFEVIDVIYPPATCSEDTDIEAGRTYSYRLIASGPISDSPPSNPVAVPIPQLSAPTLQNSGSTFDVNNRTILVDLCWNIPAGTEYVSIERRTSDQAVFELWDYVDAPGHCYQDMVDEAGKSFIYRFIAHNAIGQSAPSSQATVLIPVPAPELLAPDTTTPLQVDLEWTDDLLNESQFEFQRINPDDSISSTLKESDVTMHTSQPPMGYTYRYRVRVMAGGTWSPFSNEITATPRLAQVNLATPANNAKEVHRPTTFTWNGTASAYEYRIEIYLGSTRKDAATVTAPTTTYTSAALVGATEYRWRVQARTETGTGNGPWSDWRYFTTRASAAAALP